MKLLGRLAAAMSEILNQATDHVAVGEALTRRDPVGAEAALPVHMDKLVQHTAPHRLPAAPTARHHRRPGRSPAGR